MITLKGISMNLKRYFTGTLLLYLFIIFGDLNDLAYAKVNSIKNIVKGRDRSLKLEDYQVVVEAKEFSFIKDNLSGITYREDNNRLYAITNSPRKIYELSISGELIREIELYGFKDTEGITHVKGDIFSIVDEKMQQMYVIEIKENTTKIDIAQVKDILTININSYKNFGYEGITYDKVQKSFYIANEKFPVQVIKISNFFSKRNLDITFDAGLTFMNHFMLDFSDLFFHQKSGHLLFLSDESKMLAEVDSKSGAQISFIQIEKGFLGLKKDIPQAEGITMDTKDNLYIVSEPNLFYIFKKRAL